MKSCVNIYLIICGKNFFKQHKNKQCIACFKVTISFVIRCKQDVFHLEFATAFKVAASVFDEKRTRSFDTRCAAHSLFLGERKYFFCLGNTINI